MQTTFKVPAMSCQHCEKSIKNELLHLNGVSTVTIDLSSKIVSIEHSDNITKQMLISAIDEAGYDVEQ